MQAASLYYGLASSVAHLMVLNHLIACAWFGVSRISDNNWVLDSNIEHDAMGHQYLVCLRLSVPKTNFRWFACALRRSWCLGDAQA